MGKNRLRAAADLDEDCAPLLRRLDRIAARLSERTGRGINPRRILGRCVATFGRLLDRIRDDCARATGCRPAPDWDSLAVGEKLRVLRVTYRLPCSLHDEVLSIVAARERLRRRGGPALRLAWVRPILAVTAPGRVLAVAPRGHEVYAEWRRCVRGLRADEKLALSGRDLCDIARTLCAAGDELRAQVVRRARGRRPLEGLPGTVRLAPALRAARFARLALQGRETRRVQAGLRPPPALRTTGLRARTAP